MFSKKIGFTNKSLCLVAILFIACVSCKEKSKQADKAINNDYSINLTEQVIGNNWNGDELIAEYLSEAVYDSLKLGKLPFIPPFGEMDFQIGKVFVDTLGYKMLTLRLVSSGEISEYLLTYENGEPIDFLMVAYEDNVEYFSTTKTFLKGDSLLVETITYSGDDTDADKDESEVVTNESELSLSASNNLADTLFSHYLITPDFRFKENKQ